jgi:uncharacterized integral membrane protein
MKSLARFVLILLLIAVLLAGFLFTLNNTTSVPLWLGVPLNPQPLGLWILLAFGSGGLLGLLLGLGLWRRYRQRAEARQLRAKLRQLEQELQELKLAQQREKDQHERELREKEQHDIQQREKGQGMKALGASDATSGP